MRASSTASAGPSVADNGIVRLTAGADITGGTYVTTGGGVVEVEAGQIAQLRDFTNTGAIVARNNSDLRVLGTVNNSGSITLDSTGGGIADLQLLGNTTLAGNGTVNLIGGGINGGGLLTINAGHTVRGSGLLGQNSLRVENLGTIRGDVAGQTLSLDPASVVGGAEFFNSGLIRASNGGKVALTGTGFGEFANTTSTGTGSGVIEAVGTGSEIVLTTFASLTGGTLRGTSGGVVRTGDGENVFVTNVVHQGTHVVGNNSDYGVAGTITLDAGSVVNLNAGAPRPTSRLQGNVDLVGSGTVRLNGPLAGINGTGLLTVGSNVTVGGEGRLGQNTIRVTNRGTILGDVNGGNLTLDPSSANGVAEFINTGLVRAVNGGSVTLSNIGNGEFEQYRNGVTQRRRLRGGRQRLAAHPRRRGRDQRHAPRHGGGVVRTPAGSQHLRHRPHPRRTRTSSRTTPTSASTAPSPCSSGSTLRMQAGANATDLEVQSTASLAGSGTVILEGPLAGINGSGHSRSPSGMTVRGEGRLGQNTIAVVNNGLINRRRQRQDAPLDPARSSGNGEFDNNGILRAPAAAATLAAHQLRRRRVRQHRRHHRSHRNRLDRAADLRSQPGAAERSAAPTAAASTSATARTSSSPTSTFSGVMNVGTNTDLGIDGTVVNDGTITLDGTGAATDFEVQNSRHLRRQRQPRARRPARRHQRQRPAAQRQRQHHPRPGPRRPEHHQHHQRRLHHRRRRRSGARPRPAPAPLPARSSSTTAPCSPTDGGILVFDGFGSGEFLNNNEITVANGGQILFRNNASLTNASIAASDRLIGGTFRVFDDGIGTTFDIVPPLFDLEVNESATIEIQGPNVSSNLFDDIASSAGNLVGFKFRENGGTFIIGGGTDLTVTLPQVSPNFIDFENTGTFFVDSGSTATFRGDFGNGFVFGNEFRNTGTLGGGGTLALSGPNGDGFLDSRGGTISVGNSSGAAPATLNIVATQVAVDNAVIEVDLFSLSSFDILDVDGDLNLLPSAFNTPGQGTIAVDLGTGYLPNPGDAFEVIVADSVSGTFEAVQDAGRLGLAFDTIVGSDSVTIIAHNLLDADFNYDGVVNLADFGILRAGFGGMGGYVGGDANQDGTVNLADFGLLRANFGSSVTSSDLAMMDAWAASVPEPTAALSLMAAGGVLLGRRRR